jgi:uncharacterized protein YutE (UPF0331/DUF86 family)
MDIKARFEALVARGTQLRARVPRDEHGPEYWTPSEDMAEFQAWLSSVANLIVALAPTSSPLTQQVAAVLKHEGLKNGVPSTVFFQMQGLLSSAREEFEQGLLGRIEYVVAAATFDDFLDHAASYHKADRKIEASVLASAVLEDTVKKIAGKNGLAVAGKSLDPLIDELVKAGVLTPVKAKRVKSFAAVRNHALHAEWDSFDIRDVGELIAGTRELVEGFL